MSNSTLTPCRPLAGRHSGFPKPIHSLRTLNARPTDRRCHSTPHTSSSPSSAPLPLKQDRVPCLFSYSSLFSLYPCFSTSTFCWMPARGHDRHQWHWSGHRSSVTRQSLHPASSTSATTLDRTRISTYPPPHGPTLASWPSMPIQCSCGNQPNVFQRSLQLVV